MNLDDLKLNPETFIYQLITDAARAEQKIDQLLDLVKVANERINKRESEYESLRTLFHDLKNEVVALKSAHQTAQSNNWKWVIATGTLAAGVGAICGIIF